MIWTHDSLIRPPGPKMVVCVFPDGGLFVRINTAGWRANSVPIAARDHSFLRHDSHVECGTVFELDDYVIDQSLEAPAKGIIGCLARHKIPDLIAAIKAARGVRDEDRDAILTTLGAI